MLLSNAYSNKIDYLVDSSDKEDIINCRQTKNMTSPWLLNIGKNRVPSSSKIKEGFIEKNRVARHSEKEDEREDVNGNMSEVSFLNWEKTKYN